MNVGSFSREALIAAIVLSILIAIPFSQIHRPLLISVFAWLLLRFLRPH